MLELSYKTKGNAQPKGKPRVFFTCHPADMERSLDRLCSDLWGAQDCAVYYTEDMAELIGDEDRALQLEQMNLFVVPVSLKLLIEPNRAMDQDVPFAMDKHIPILPIMLESGLDVVYSREDKFGPLQYLDPEAHDITAISYEEKLKKYLSSVLIDDATAERVRKAFDAYIFLSYRKKDRKYANELMRLIHADPQCRDIAIWYDEYLTPGESFSDAIQTALDKSELFALLVTPNLVNEENYIQTTEYPAARQSGKPILPVEMAETDRKALESHYHDIPACTTPDDEQFQARLMNSLRRIALRENDADPIHNYLIGLAYLDGIDVEVNKERGLDLITSAAEVGLPEAMRKLYDMYGEGGGVPLNYREALKWARRLADYCIIDYGEEHPETMASLNNLAYTYSSLGEYQKALELHEKVYTLNCRILGEEHPDTLTSLSNFACIYDSLGEYQKALELHEKVYALRRRILGEEHPDTLSSLNNVAIAYGSLGEHQKALKLHEKEYALSCRILGEEHPDTLTSLSNFAYTFVVLGNHEKALELNENVYALRCRILGEEHPDTLTSLNNLAFVSLNMGEYQKALELNEKVYALFCRVLGEEHPDTLTSLSNLASTYVVLGNHERALELHEKGYTLFCRILGEEHPHTLTSYRHLADTYHELGDHKKGLELDEELYARCCRVLGEEHPDTLSSLHALAYTYGKLMGNHKKALKLNEKVYTLRSRILGEDHLNTLNSLNNLAYSYAEFGDHKKALELNRTIYDKRCKILGENHPDTLASLNKIIVNYEKLGQTDKAQELRANLEALRLKKDAN